jgi:hypothetical protein
MDYIYTTAAVSTLTVGVIFYNHYALKIDYDLCKAVMLDFTNKCVKKLVGISSLHQVRKHYFVKTDLGPLVVNYHKTPSLDTDVYLFNKGHHFSITENRMMTKKNFEQKYKDEDTTLLRKFNFGIIADIYYPRDFKNKDKLVGFIFNSMENEIYVFVVDQNQIIDYRKIFNDYDKALLEPVQDIINNDNGEGERSSSSNGSGVDELVRITSQTETEDIDALD